MNAKQLIKKDDSNLNIRHYLTVNRLPKVNVIAILSMLKYRSQLMFDGIRVFTSG
jgi:hypothetical protein